jgi:uncharacterized membrane protein YphA (DoxX/SURF4 family)
MEAKMIGYWVATATLVFAVLSGGIWELARTWGTLETVTILGYPPYLLTILGVWKVLGSVALLVPRVPRLKEWAYAGIFFGMTGAAVSHAMKGDYGTYGYHLIVTLSLAALALVSWALRPQSRTLGVLFPAAMRASGPTIEPAPAAARMGRISP